ncbi:hypothetical protein [Oleiagrimonas sp. C23AA]|uniref:hypothetical protein n=1 Tax=Oleiagrimonas sp. C23AA TaxID=2719047 RepID=UPI0014230DC3|nr:hypothetical protein [Oleiagrimonas sp. C23AA]NII11087.1 hypothetical protein [Oleiagrimonas sp. C23AA]
MFVPSLAEKVEFLQHPGSYAEPTREVTAIETHMSWVFLTDHYAYKLKKPYSRDLIDYSTVHARKLSSQREVRLNQRLAEGVYLDVVALKCDREHRLSLGGRGRIVDWLVRMRRLPLAQTLEYRLRVGRATRQDACQLVERWWSLYADAAHPHISAVEWRRRLLDDITLSEHELLRPEFALPEHEVRRLVSALCDFLAQSGPLLDSRADSHHLAEGHGDLRPEHVYFTQPLAIIDCIEFDLRLRQRDPVDELAFLALECERLEHPEWREWLLEHYRRLSGDRPDVALVAFYQALHALRRARLAILHIEDPETGAAWHWADSARDYLRRGWEHMAVGDDGEGAAPAQLMPRRRR